MKPTLLLTPVLSHQPVQKAGDLDVVVRVQVPAHQGDVTPRPTLNLALALDVSGSMSGLPLAQAKQAVIDIIRRLAPTDRVAVLAYDTSVETVLESMAAHQAQALIEQRLAVCHEGGGTGLHAGWLHAAEAAAPFVNQYGLTRVLLLSDGQATDGSTPDKLEAEASRLAEAGIGTSTYGIGHNFNEALMSRMAVGGQAFYADNAQTLLDYFGNEFTILAATVGTRVRLTAQAVGPQGEALALTNLNGHRESQGGWQLPALIEGAETWVALSVASPALKTKQAITLSGTVSWVDTQGKAHDLAFEQVITARAKAGAQDTWAFERVSEARAAELQRQALKAVQEKRFEDARNFVGLARSCSVNNAYIQGVSDELESKAASGDWNGFSKQAMYASTTMSTRQAESVEDATKLGGDRLGLRKAAQDKADKTHKPAPKA